MFFRSIRILPAFLALFFQFEEAYAENRFEKPSELNFSYNAEKDSLKLSWERVTNAKKYIVILKDASASEVFSKTTKKNEIDINGATLVEDVQYLAEIKALKNGATQTSKAAKKKYKFTRRVSTAEKTGTFETINSGGRRGEYFLPKNYRLKTLPLMIIFHGSNISGSNVLKLFQKLAAKEEFIILAPDSSDPAGWNVPDSINDSTEDETHFYALLQELKSFPHINIDSENTLVAGISAGGFMASFLGTNDSQFKFIANLHGGIVFSGVGVNKVPFYLATGSNDEIRPPSFMIQYREELLDRGFPEVLYEEFNVAHQVLEEEQNSLINWWLRR